MTTTPTGDRATAPHGDEEEAVARLCDRLAPLAPPRCVDAVLALARAAYRRTSPERLRSGELDRAAAQIADAFSFIDARRPGELALRVYNAGDRGGTVVEVNVEDGPFLLSTLTEELRRLGLAVASTMHPIFGVERDEHGRVAQIVPARHARQRESWIRIELAERVPPERLEQLDVSLRAVLGDALAVIRDFPAMRAQVEEVGYHTRASAGGRYAPEEVDEALDLLDWLLDDHFILLGYREYDLVEQNAVRYAQVHPGSGLGILTDESRSTWARPVPVEEIPPELRYRVVGGPLLVVSRTNRVSTVHRQTRMLYIGLKKVSGTGEVIGEFRLLGLFAHKAFAEPASSVPVLRRKLQQILEREDVIDHSYDERALRALFEAFPKEELFQADIEELRRSLVALLVVQKRQDVRLLLHARQDNRAVSALVAIPQERFTDRVRVRVEALLRERFAPASIDYQLSITEREQALLHFVLYPPDGERFPSLASRDAQQLEHEVRMLARTWADALADALVERFGADQGHELAEAWTSRFPAEYRERTAASTAVDDIAYLAQLQGAVDTALAVLPTDAPDAYRIKLYRAGSGIELSSFLPILESLGLVVVEEVPHRLDSTAPLHIHDFGVRLGSVPAAARTFDPSLDGARLAAAALAMWDGRAEADSLNRLVLHAGLGWEDVAVLRAYRRYRRQLGTSFTEAYQNNALVAHPQVTCDLVALFRALFDPDPGETADEPVAARTRVERGLDAVERLDHDRILRGFLGLVDATLRTNRYVPEPQCLAFKLDSARVPGISKPVPHVEVFVYSPAMEGIHLRGGRVARGGIRWSDRLEDFRTEVLGLMKAQMVKNAVIVPTGAKGGFVLKRPPEDSTQVVEEVRRQYEVFIRGLLDITDNVVEEGGTTHVVTPRYVRRRDEQDPYLVVAADRGTAAFSDLANSISAQYGFWLGDAFASGGSHGYDHKAMGITARGAWVAVQRHFRELNIDVQTDSITVVGIGDMSGDVFGNGLLQSNAVQLVAAFDHRDIFIDPDPDPVISFAERQRLFQLPRSSWQDYDRARLSPGGAVYARTAKKLTLSEQARRVLRLDQEHLTPPELVRAILRAPVDLLFAGGIGTFVKARDETNADVGDRANDAVRIDAEEVGARVVGEGGNLAVTQRGRIAYARRGGHINTDFIDNAAGVDTSDHEVNLKILLGMVVERGRLSQPERDVLLADMADDVAEAVLRDVYLQTWALSEELTEAPGGLEPYETVMDHLERSGRLDRDVEALPSSEEMTRRAGAGAGLTRPELAVLLCSAKVDLAARLLTATLPDQAYLEGTLRSYFPPSAVGQFGDLLWSHPLRRELVATIVANDVVNRMGITWHARTGREFGVGFEQVVATYWMARDVAEADAAWRAVEALDETTAPALQLELKAGIDRLVDAHARAYLRHEQVADIGAVVQRDRPAFLQLIEAAEALGFPTRRPAWRAQLDRYLDLGLEPELAARLVWLAQLAFVPDVATVARAGDYPVLDVARVFLRLTELLPVEPLRERLAALEPVDEWERWQHRGLIDELRQLRRAAAERALAAYPGEPASEIAERFVQKRARSLERVTALLQRLEREPAVGLSAVAVAVRLLWDVVDAG